MVIAQQPLEILKRQVVLQLHKSLIELNTQTCRKAHSKLGLQILS